MHTHRFKKQVKEDFLMILVLTYSQNFVSFSRGDKIL